MDNVHIRKGLRRGGVSVQSFYFDEPAEGNKLFLCKILIENNEKEAWGWPT